MKPPELFIRKNAGDKVYVENERAKKRKKLHQIAMIAHDRRRLMVPCVIVDISLTGARVRVDCASSLPDIFELINIKYRLDTWCQVRWQLDDDLGVMFIEEREALDLGASLEGNTSKRTNITKLANPRPSGPGPTYI